MNGLTDAPASEVADAPGEDLPSPLPDSPVQMSALPNPPALAAFDEPPSGVADAVSDEADNVFPFPSPDTVSRRGRRGADDWVTVEKRRSSQSVVAHYVRCKDEAGKKKVGLTDYMSVSDFRKRFSRRKTDYEKYKKQLIAIYEAQALRTRQGTVSNPRRSL